MMTMQGFVVERNEKADELATERADVDGGLMTAARAFQQFKKVRKTSMFPLSVRHIFMCSAKIGKREMNLCRGEKFRGRLCTR